MTDVKKMTLAERAGHKLGRWVKPLVRLEAAIVQRLVTAGIPSGLALTLKWAIRCALALALLYFALIPALIILVFFFFLTLGGGEAETGNDDMEEITDYMRKEEEALKPKWREGHSGWGLYSHDDQALDVDNRMTIRSRRSVVVRKTVSMVTPALYLSDSHI
ncbi:MULTISPECIES: DUF3742 family protein [Serratia]|uniref:DUF3742 family protein n=1 Tax=Serratia TaxID=613 RepID=UPI000F0B2E4A|nr:MULTISPECIES: DUF3742 family protein [Serratia]AYU89951.1 DUF3742 family protein [Serratia sp. LS-1]MBH2559324.1 DUF3742 family protein [Serratia ureilytica]